MINSKNNISIRWGYLAVGVVAMLFAGVLYAWSILKSPLAADFSWSASSLALNFTLAMSFFCIGGLLGARISKGAGHRVALMIAGILAAAGIYALKNNVARLQEDHDNAAWMAEQLREAGADVMRQDTNMLFVRVGEENAAALGEYMKARNVLINASPIVRLVTHLDVSRAQLAEVAAHWRAFLAR